jgi:hypothetical protein
MPLQGVSRLSRDGQDSYMFGGKHGRSEMRNDFHMKARRKQYGNQKVVTGFLTCDACGKRFISGRVQFERRFLIDAVCNNCIQSGNPSRKALVEMIVNPSGKTVYANRT